MILVYVRLTLLVVSLLAFSGATALEVTQTIPESEVSGTPSMVSYLLYESREATEPLGILDFTGGTYQLSNQQGQIQISAELGDEFEGEKLWVQLEIDGIPTGERIALESAPVGVTFASGNNLNMDGNTIANLEMPVTPGSGLDAANRAYVDSVANDTVSSAELDNLCDADGSILKRLSGSWVCADAPASDNLGNHIASENLQMNGQWISRTGLDQGMHIGYDGSVLISTAEGSSWAFIVEGRILSESITAQGWIKAESPVTVGSTTLSCNSNLVGSIRYMPDTGDFSGCTGDANDNGIIGDYAWVKLN